MVNADIDLTADQVNYTIDDDFFTNFLAGRFTGPIFENIAAGGPEFYSASIDPTNNTIGLEASDVIVLADRLTVNLQSIFFDNGDSFTLNVGFLYRGSNAADTITGAGFNDRVVGSGGNDHLAGGRGLDRLQGQNGNDTLDGGGGGDAMAGGAGNDRYISDNANDRFIEAGNAGIDTLFTAVGRAMSGNLENVFLTGAAGFMIGNGLANQIHGNDLANALVGGAGDDWIYGGGGNDRITGGPGVDHLVGDAGIDTFVFTEARGSDVVHGFQRGIDMLDLAAIDANSAAAGNQAFDYVGNAAFSGAGDLRYVAGILAGDVNGDGRADFRVEIANHPPLAESDLIL